MKKEVYEALKIVVRQASVSLDENQNKSRERIKYVRSWLDEVAKEHEVTKCEGVNCKNCEFACN